MSALLKLLRKKSQYLEIGVSALTEVHMTITSIENYNKGKGRAVVYLNNEFAFILYKGELDKHELAVGKSLDDEDLERIIEETLSPRAIKRAMNLIKTVDRTEYDIRSKLKEGG